MLSHSASRTPVTSLSLDCAPAATARAGARSRQSRRHRLSSVRTASPSAPAACPAGLSWSGAAPAASACLCALLAWKLRCPGCLMLSSVCQVSCTEAPRVAPMQCRPSWLLAATVCRCQSVQTWRAWQRPAAALRRISAARASSAPPCPFCMLQGVHHPPLASRNFIYLGICVPP